MENATNAIKTVFGVICFCIALGICFMLFGRLKLAFDTVTYSKSNSYIEKQEYESNNPILNQKRIVGKELVISSIFDYSESGYIIYLQKGNYNEETGKLSNVSKINIYRSNVLEDLNYFSIEEEKNRNESWTTSHENIIKHLKVLLYGGKYEENSYTGILNNELKGNQRILEEISKKVDTDGNEKTIIYYTII